MVTYKYKDGYIHVNFTLGITRVQVDRFAYTIEVKSYRAAQLMITKHYSKVKGVN